MRHGCYLGLRQKAPLNMFQKEVPDKVLIKRLYSSSKRSVNDYCIHQRLSLMSPAFHSERNFVPYPCKQSSFQGQRGEEWGHIISEKGRTSQEDPIGREGAPGLGSLPEQMQRGFLLPSTSHLVLQQQRGGVKPPIKMQDWKEVPEVFLPKYLWQKTSVTALQQSKEWYLWPSQSHETPIPGGPFYHDILARK